MATRLGFWSSFPALCTQTIVVTRLALYVASPWAGHMGLLHTVTSEQEPGVGQVHWVLPPKLN